MSSDPSDVGRLRRSETSRIWTNRCKLWRVAQKSTRSADFETRGIEGTHVAKSVRRLVIWSAPGVIRCGESDTIRRGFFFDEVR